MENSSKFRRIAAAFLATGSLLAGAIGVGVAAPAAAVGPGVYFATGHDLDYHCAPVGDAEVLSCNQLKAMIDAATPAVTPRVLAITSNANSYLTGALAEITGITATSIDALTNPGDYATANFSNYDVIVTQSVYGNEDGDTAPDEWVTTLNTRKADLIAFYNSGGGVIQQGNGGDDGSAVWAQQYYLALGFYAASVDQTDPRTVTAAGTAIGLTDAMSNCCATHNAFVHPPTTMQDLELDANGLAVTVEYTGTPMPAAGIGGNTLSGTLEIDRAAGQPVLGAVVNVAGTWFKTASAFTIMVDTTPQTACDTGSATDPTNIYGAFQCSFALPALAAGPHKIVLTGLAPDGSTVTRTGYLVVDAQGNIVSWSFSEEALAETGSNENEMLTISMLASLFLAAGAVVLLRRRKA
jgi:LPXTG-motif cell wall-anchored protein